jgi:predicted phage terminase large subunit-like protein
MAELELRRRAKRKNPEIILAEQSYYEFIKQAWPYVDPAPYGDNWHIKFLADHLQAFFCSNKLDMYDYLVINIPPNFGKSLYSSVFLPAWDWIANPNERWLTGSKTEELAIRDSRRARDLLTSDWFQDNWGGEWGFKSDENRKKGYENDKQGFRNIFSMMSRAVTGKRGNRLVIDDPNDASDTYNIKALKDANEWFAGTFTTRGNIFIKTRAAIIQQRIAEGDLSGYLLDKLGDKVLHICLPMEFDSSHRCITPLGQDPRKEDGEFLWNVVSLEDIERQKLLLGNMYYAQYQQQPTPLEGTIFKITDFHYYKPEDKPEHFDKIIDSTDVAEKTGKTNDYSVITIWGILGNKKYLLYRWRGKLEYPELKKKWEEIGDIYQPHQRLVEDKSSGTPLIQEMKRSSKYPMLAIKPQGSKEARADAVRPEFQAGNVLFPANASWLSEYTQELLTFPGGDHDDQVDSTTQFLNHVAGRRGLRVRRVT